MRAKVLAVAAAVAVPLSMVTVVPAASAAPKAPATPPAPTASGDGQFMAVAASDADYAGLKADVQNAGGRVLKEMPEIQTVVVKAPKAAKAKLAASTHAAAVATDHIESLSPPDQGMQSPALRKSTIPGPELKPPVTPDPAYFDPGLLWNEMRVRMTQAFRVTTGAKAVTVGVADTGLDFTHVELASKIKASDVVDFTQSENPPICPTYFQEGVTDATLAAKYGGPEKTDWNGHGTWIGGNIAAALDGQGVNGIAPNVKLVPLKISQWCGSAYDSEILDAFLYAADHGIDIVSISFGGYLDRSDPDQNAIYKQYVAAVKYAKGAGTTIVAAAGNEHLRIGAGGKVLSHGPLTTPGTTAAQFQDYYGLYETPGGIPGVVDVSSTGNLVNASSKSCSTDTQTATFETCKPTSDPHQQTGAGLEDQLAYYSNFGPRIDVAGPGGARMFNLPLWDRGGTPGFPYTDAGGTTAWEDFSITSNWAQEIPCFTFTGGGFPAGQCYSTIQGTSMATPHASAVVALIASAQPSLRGNVDGLVQVLESSARTVRGNTTPGLSATDTSAGDASSLECPTGYCHLGGPAIPDKEAYGTGVVDAAAAVGIG
jgi:subtilisin family serine protease